MQEGIESIFHELVIKAMLFDYHPRPVWVKEYLRDSDTFVMCFVNEAYDKKYKTQAKYEGKQDEQVWDAKTAKEFEKHDREALMNGIAWEELNGERYVKWRIINPITGQTYIAGGEI